MAIVRSPRVRRRRVLDRGVGGNEIPFSLTWLGQGCWAVLCAEAGWTMPSHYDNPKIVWLYKKTKESGKFEFDFVGVLIEKEIICT